MMDNDGNVVRRFENFAPEEELELSLMSVLSAESDEQSDASDAPTSAPAEVPATEQEPAATVVSSSSIKRFEVDDSSTWGDAFEQFSDEEQQCVRDELGDGYLEIVLGQSIAATTGVETWEVGLSTCLEDDTFKAIVLANTLAMAEPELSEAGALCVEDLIAETDMVAVIAGEKPDAEPENVAAAGRYFAGFLSCLLADQIGSMDGLGEAELCLANLFESTDFAEVYVGQRPDADPNTAAMFEDFMNGMFGCLAGAMATGLEGALGDAQPSQ